jgi:hypothetical protein
MTPNLVTLAAFLVLPFILNATYAVRLALR